jgi:tRNA G10  N-methylase Trm11
MPYRYVLQDLDDSDLSSGLVLYSLPGQAAFPVRLASEIFLRCLALSGIKTGQKVTLYDPLCGGAYHLTALAFKHWDNIQAILASDIRPEATDLAKRNLSLLSQAGMDKRIAQIEENIRLYGKASHLSALASAQILHKKLLNHLPDSPIQTTVFQADALKAESLLLGLSAKTVRLIISDLPYGIHSHWEINQPLTASINSSEIPVETILLESLRSVLSEGAVVALASTKNTKIAHPEFRRIDQLKIGKRKVTFLRLQENPA